MLETHFIASAKNVYVSGAKLKTVGSQQMNRSSFAEIVY
jgi:hypothetical protein